MIDDEFESTENLFRAILSHYWDEEKQEISTTAAFKDRKGASIDRQGGREFNECLAPIIKAVQKLSAIVHFSVDESKTSGAFPKSFPLPDNPFHCLLIQANGSLGLSEGTLKRLQRLGNQRICYKTPRESDQSPN